MNAADTASRPESGADPPRADTPGTDTSATGTSAGEAGDADADAGSPSSAAARAGPAGEPSGRPGAVPRAWLGGQAGEAASWVLVTAVLAGVTALLAASGVAYSASGLAAGRGIAWGTLPLGWPPRLGPSTLLPPVAAAVALGAVALTARRRKGLPAPPFGPLLGLSYVASAGWWLALGVASRRGLGAPASLLAAADRHPSDLLDAASGRPPGPELLVWGLGQLGIRGATAVGVAFTLIGALVVPLVGLAVRSLCHTPAARRLLPVLVFAPWAPFAVAGPDAVTAAVAAAAVAVGVVGSERGRSAWWALGAGLLLGVSGLFAYPAIWLGVAVAAAYFVRRRPMLNVITGAGALAPLFALRLAGYSWPEGLARAGADLFDHAALTWLVPDLLAVSLCCGPALARAARRVSMTPGWPFLVGAAAAALFALLMGLAAGGVEASWLPLFPWLVVPALAPRPRPALPGDTSSAGRLPYGLVCAGAALATALAALLPPG
ncbi:hypothetical protein [Pseudofrankia sp. BMG5.37]|uniref:hypothetical protein n=1 Tax=Pseudofrankia sp. BMG5.37 TaxID=3050035 RepID=UPI002893BB9C|nr:hypothetical protein [Pseudofrankia sp. BMG5.37]MDT3442021.1 hypothetical protein [Pseudofrankia sp. BMG5.37]